MSQALQAPIDVVDYLAFEEARQVRHEYIAGRVYAMAGGHDAAPSHRGQRVSPARRTARRHGLPVFMEGMPLHVQAADSVYDPDVFVFSGSAIARGAKVAADATLVVEVLTNRRARRCCGR